MPSRIRVPGRPRPGRARIDLLLSVNVAYTVGVAVYAVAGGSGWPWLLLSVVPPVSYLIIPLLLAAASSRSHRRRWHLPVLTAALMVGLHLVGLNLAALLPAARGHPSAGDPLQVTSWNTEYWDQTDDPERFYAYLDDHFRDVMMLQEALDLGADGTSLIPLDLSRELGARLPGAHVVQRGELIVLSRFPVDRVVDVSPGVLRVDIEVRPTQVISFYDVHLLTQVDLGLDPLHQSFYRTVADRYRQRGAQVEALVADMQRNPHAAVVAGDFNTSPSMGSIRAVQAMTDDVAAGSRSLLPLSWNARHAIPLFRLDWMFVRNDLRADEFRFVTPDGMSDHDLQEAVIRYG